MMAHRLRFAALLLLAGCSSPPAALPGEEADREFLALAARVNYTEAATALLVGERSRTPQVRRYAQIMVEHHTRDNQVLAALADRKNIRLPEGPDESQRQEAVRLSEMSGADFDREYIALMRRHHAEAIERFECERERTRDREIRSYIRKSLSLLREHLRSAVAIQEILGAPAPQP